MKQPEGWGVVCLKLLGVTAKTMVFWPLVCLIVAIYTSAPADAADLIFLYVFSLPIAAGAYALRAGAIRAGRNRWWPLLLFLSLAAGLIAAAFTVLGALRENILVAVCTLGAQIVCYFWGAKAAGVDSAEVLTPTFQIPYIAVTVLCVLIAGLIGFLSHKENLIEPGPLLVTIVLFALLSFFVMSRTNMEFTIRSLGRTAAPRQTEVRRFNRTLSLLGVGGVLAFFLLCWGGIARLCRMASQALGEAVTGYFSWRIAPDGHPAAEASVEKVEAELNLPGDYASKVDPTVSLLLVTGLVVLLLYLFRRPIGDMFRYWLTRASYKRREYAGKGYTDLVETLQANDAAVRLLRRDEARPSLAAQLRAYRGLTRPEDRVRRGLYLLRALYTRRKVAFREGDTPREMLARMDADPAALRAFGAAYERARYAGVSPTQAEGEQAAALVERVAAGTRTGARE